MSTSHCLTVTSSGRCVNGNSERSGRSVMMDDDDDELASLAHFWEVRRLSHFAKNMTYKG